MAEKYVRLSERTSADGPADVLHEGIPPHLHSTVSQFIEVTCTSRNSYGDQKPNVDTLRQIERTIQVPLDWDSKFHALGSLKRAATTDAQVGLDLLDFLIHVLGDHPLTRDLDASLTQAGSAWRVASDWSGLERRVDETVAASAEAASEHGKSGEHLRRAWSAAFGVSPDPSAAYSQAIKAVEAAAHPIVVPNDPLATLGKMIGEIKSAAAKFEVLLQGNGDIGAKGDTDAVTIVRLMSQLLWTGQHDRHGTFDPAKPISVTQAEAEAAVHLAALLVQWFESGVIRRKP